MPTGVTRNDTALHDIMLKILNSLHDWSRHSPSANHRLTTLWGWPGDDMTHELDQISVDVSYNFNRMNKVTWKVPTQQQLMQEDSSSSTGGDSSSDKEESESTNDLSQSTADLHQSAALPADNINEPDQSDANSHSESELDEPKDSSSP